MAVVILQCDDLEEIIALHLVKQGGLVTFLRIQLS